MEKIVLAGGCFWCLEAVFARVRGVARVESGYANGHVPAPSYEAVCGGQTGHAEVVAVEFDPATLSLGDVLTVFFAMHDPTTLNRQGNDVGTQYRSGIYFSSEAQAEAVRAWMGEMPMDPHWAGSRVVTEVVPLDNYWPAEGYHQQYFENNPHQGYCAYVVAPKVQKLLRDYREYLA